MSETDLVADMRLELSRGDVRLFRNNVGVLNDRYGNFITYGLCVGSSDLIGFRSITITPEMVGKSVAVFTAIEVKKPRKNPTVEQQNFLRMVEFYGGIYGVARSTEEARQVLTDYHCKVRLR